MNTRRTITALVSLVLGLAFAVVSATPSGAQDSDEQRTVFGIKPGNVGRTTLDGGHFAYAVEPGTTIEDEAIVINYSDEPINVRVYPADVRTARGGALAPAQRDERMRDAGAWIRLEDPEMATLGIPPHERRAVPFTVHVPKTAVPGDHPAAIVASLDLGRDSAGVNVQARAALMARVSVLGDVDLGVDVGQIRAQRTDGGYRFDVPVRNMGNVLFTTAGTIELNSGGRTIGTLPLNPRGIYVIPDGETTLSVLWRRPPRFGRVQAVAHVAATVGDRPARTFTSQRTITLVPWLAIGLAVAVLAVGSLVFVGTRSRRRAWRRRRNVEREIIRDHRSRTSELARTGGPRHGE